MLIMYDYDAGVFCMEKFPRQPGGYIRHKTFVNIWKHCAKTGFFLLLISTTHMWCRPDYFCDSDVFDVVEIDKGISLILDTFLLIADQIKSPIQICRNQYIFVESISKIKPKHTFPGLAKLYENPCVRRRSRSQKF
jgi:hypothetical protein